MKLYLAIQKAGQLNAHFLPEDAHGLRWLYQTCGQWSDPTVKEISKRELVTKVFAFVTVPMALGYSAYFFARGLFQSGTCILHGRMKEAVSISKEDGGSAFKCLVLMVTNVAYALLGLALGHTLYKAFIPPPSERSQTQDFDVSWNHLKAKLETVQKELGNLNEKIEGLHKEKTQLEQLCHEEKKNIHKYQREIENQKKILENYSAQIRELELTLSSLNAATALKLEISEKNLELEDKTKELREKQKTLQEQQALIEQLKLDFNKIESLHKQWLTEQRTLNEKIAALGKENSLLKSNEQQLQSTLNEKNEEVTKLSEQLEDLSFFDAEDTEYSENPSASSYSENTALPTEQIMGLSPKMDENVLISSGANMFSSVLTSLYPSSGIYINQNM